MSGEQEFHPEKSKFLNLYVVMAFGVICFLIGHYVFTTPSAVPADNIINFTSMEFKSGYAEGYGQRMVDEVVNYTWYLRFGNDTIGLIYPQEAATEAFAPPRNYSYTRCINGSWYCTQRVCVVFKTARIQYQAGYLCSEKNFQDLENMFLDSGKTRAEIGKLIQDARDQCRLQELERQGRVESVNTTI